LSSIEPSTSADKSVRRLIWPTDRLPYYSEKGKFLGSIAARMRSRPNVTVSPKTMRRYAKAILATMPEDARDKEWENGVQGAASAAAQQAGVRDMRDVGYRGADDQEMSGLLDTGDNRSPEEDLAVQLRQYSDASITGNSFI
jgi:hypothetical protein